MFSHNQAFDVGLSWRANRNRSWKMARSSAFLERRFAVCGKLNKKS